jgi:hypothetical protein
MSSNPFNFRNSETYFPFMCLNQKGGPAAPGNCGG